MSHMTDVQFHQLLLRLDRIAAALERLAPANTQGEDKSAGAAASCGAAADVAAAAECEPSAPDGPVTLVPELLQRFLSGRGIRVRCVPPPRPADPVLDRMALHLGTRYAVLKDVLAWMKRTMQTGGRWYLKLGDRPQEEIGACCQFCHQLHELAFLTEYRYHRAPRCLIEARTSTAPEAQNFLSGQWLERFIRQQAEAAAGERDFALIANAQIVLPNNDDFELDLLAAIGGAVYWIESKTGAYQQYVRKYSQMGRTLGLGPSRSFLVLADAPAAVCADLSRMTGMTVCRPEDFHAAFRQAITQQQTTHQAAR